MKGWYNIIERGTTMKEINMRVKQLREELKLSREKFAEIAGINDYYLGEIERGEKKASLDILFKIANQFCK